MITRRGLLGLMAVFALALFAAPAARAVERIPFDQAAFDAAVKSGGPVLVDISASWCVTCRAQRNVLGKLFGDPAYKGYQVFVVDYDTEKDVMRGFGASQRATLIVFRNGVEVGRIVGDTREAAIGALLASGA